MHWTNKTTLHLMYSSGQIIPHWRGIQIACSWINFILSFYIFYGCALLTQLHVTKSSYGPAHVFGSYHICIKFLTTACPMEIWSLTCQSLSTPLISFYKKERLRWDCTCRDLSEPFLLAYALLPKSHEMTHTVLASLRSTGLMLQP